MAGLSRSETVGRTPDLGRTLSFRETTAACLALYARREVREVGAGNRWCLC